MITRSTPAAIRMFISFKREVSELLVLLLDLLDLEFSQCDFKQDRLFLWRLCEAIPPWYSCDQLTIRASHYFKKITHTGPGSNVKLETRISHPHERLRRVGTAIRRPGHLAPSGKDRKLRLGLLPS